MGGKSLKHSLCVWASLLAFKLFFVVKITIWVWDFLGVWIVVTLFKPFFCRLADKNLNKVEFVFNVNGRQNLTFEREPRICFPGWIQLKWKEAKKRERNWYLKVRDHCIVCWKLTKKDGWSKVGSWQNWSQLITKWAQMVSYHGPVGKCPKIIPFVIIKKLALRDQILCRFEKEQ